MTQMIKFADMNIKTFIINIFQMFKKVEKRFSLLKGDVDGTKKTQNFLSHKKYYGWYFRCPRTTHMEKGSLL